MSSETVSVADDHLRSFYERWQRLEEEKQAISDDLKELFAEAKGNGFDTKAMRAVFRDMGKDSAERDEAEAIYDLYWSSLNKPRAGRAPARTREATIFPDPHLPEVDGGQPPPSSDADSAKTDGLLSIVGQGGDQPGIAEVKSERQDASASQGRNEPVSDSGATADHFEPPAFLLKREHAPLRPLCQNPGDNGHVHCRACLVAAGESEAA